MQASSIRKHKTNNRPKFSFESADVTGIFWQNSEQ